MQSAKIEALETIAKLPDEASYDEILYRLYVLKKIHEGRDSAAREPIRTTEEIQRELSTW